MPGENKDLMMATKELLPDCNPKQDTCGAQTLLSVANNPGTI